MLRSTLALRTALAGGRHWLPASLAAGRVHAVTPLACQARRCSDSAAKLPPLRLPNLDTPQRLPNLYTLVSELPKYGVGAKVYRSTWADKDYTPSDYHWLVTKVELVDKGVDKQLKRGKVWGVKRWKGVAEEKVKLIRTPLKKEWVHLFL